MINLYKHQRFC